jgi:hypothetical protein
LIDPVTILAPGTPNIHIFKITGLLRTYRKSSEKIMQVGKRFPHVANSLFPIPLISIGINGEAYAAETEGNKRKRNLLLAIRHFARSPINMSN